IEATSRGQTFDSATGTAALDTFGNNNAFRLASFRPRKQVDFSELVRAGDAYADTFGTEDPELSLASIVTRLRDKIERASDLVAEALVTLKMHSLPGAGALEAGLEPMRAILRGSEEGAFTTFNSSHRSIKDASSARLSSRRRSPGRASRRSTEPGGFSLW